MLYHFDLMKEEQDRITRELSESESQVRMAEVRVGPGGESGSESIKMHFLKHCYESYMLGLRRSCDASSIRQCSRPSS